MKFLKNGKNHEDKSDDHDEDHDGEDDILEISGCSVRPCKTVALKCFPFSPLVT